MKQDTDSKANIRQYLLGGLAPEGQSDVEKELLTNNEYFDELVAEEDELIDDYLDGALTEVEREQFETCFLAAPERGWKLEFARLLKGYVDPEAPAVAPEPVVQQQVVHPPQPPTFWQSLSAFFNIRNPAALALAAFLVLSGGVLVSVLLRREQAQQVSTREENSNSPREALAPVLVVTLTPGRERNSTAAQRVVVQPGVNTIQLRLELIADEYPRYAAALRAEDEEIFADRQLKAESAAGANFVAVNVPARLLPPGDYRLSLSGEAPDGRVDNIGSYVFKISGR